MDDLSLIISLEEGGLEADGYLDMLRYQQVDCTWGAVLERELGIIRGFQDVHPATIPLVSGKLFRVFRLARQLELNPETGKLEV